MKVVNALARDGFIETVRGRSGGMRLARPADRITVGDVVRRTEEGFELADCSGCALSPACGLTGVLAAGMQAMMAVFDSYTIEIGRAHLCTPVTTAHLVCRLLLATTKTTLPNNIA